VADPEIKTRTLSDTDFDKPSDDRYFEDYKVGAVYEYGTVNVSEDDILEYARRFDPQKIHIDPEFAAAGPFQGLIGSGWHSAGIAMRLLVDHYLSQVGSLASPGVDEVRWATPMRPGDELRVRVTIADARVSKSKPDRGIVSSHVELINQDGGRPVSLKATNFLLLRNPA
jgi:acyl dehydratase